MKKRIIIAHYSDLLLLGASIVLQRSPAVHVAAKALCFQSLLQAASAHQPDIVFLSEKLDPGWDVFGMIDRLKHVGPRARLIVIGSLKDGLFVRDLFAVGIRGYLYESDLLEASLVDAVEIVMQDRLFLSMTANAEYLVAMQSPERDWKLDIQSRMMLRLLAQGLHVGEIAARMGLTVGRVYEIRRKLRRRFHVTTNEHLVLRAAEEGFRFYDD